MKFDFRSSSFRVSRFVSHRLLRGICGSTPVLALGLATAISALAAGAPAGVSASDWSQIRAEYERHRHAAIETDGEHRARNVGQQWLNRFDGHGVLVEPDNRAWTWGLQLESYGWSGRAANVSRPAAVESNVERVSYQWDDTLVEWYVNDARGLEHGYTLRRAPAGSGDSIEINMAVRGGLDFQVEADGRAARFVDSRGAVAVNYAGLRVWDAAGKDLPARMERTGDRLRLSVEAAGAAYPLTIDPIASQAYLKASNSNPADGFGWAVAMQGETIVVTAPGEASLASVINGDQSDNSAFNSGAAYVFIRSGGSWALQSYLKPSNTGMNDAFGLTVAIAENTIVIGAPGEDSAATGVNGAQGDNSVSGAGAAYVFVRGGDVWTQQAYLKAINPGAMDAFGSSLDISGHTIVVGAPNEDSTATGVYMGVHAAQSDNGQSGTGAAYTFVRSGTTWSFDSYIKASNTGELDAFGGSVAIDRDTILVGAAGESSNATIINGDQTNDSATGAGAAYVFTRSGGLWSQQAYLKASNAQTIDAFGNAVGLAGDTAVIGARGEDGGSAGVNGAAGDNSISASGAAFIFIRKGGLWSQQAYLKASNPDAFDLFGDRVAITSDTVVVTATGEDSALGGEIGNQGNNASSGAGAAYVFRRSGETWSQQAFLKASNANPFDTFGASAAITPVAAVLGATQEDSASSAVNFGQTNNDAINSGAAYVFSGVATTPAQELGVFIGGQWFIDRDGDFAFNPASELFGWGSPGDVPVRGDWNGDGFQDMGVFSGGIWFIDLNGDSLFDPATEIKGWGLAGWIPVVGDWNGDGVSDLGAVDPATSTWYRDINGDFIFDPITEIYTWGSPGDKPMPGDWNGDGITDVGVVSGATWLIDAAGNGAFDAVTDVRGWGVPGWIPVVGDWDGDGGDELGMIDPATMSWFRDVNGDYGFDASTEVLGWGSPGNTPVVGDWNGDGRDDVGVFSGGVWFIDANGDGLFQSVTEARGWGVAGWTPVPGAWQ